MRRIGLHILTALAVLSMVVAVATVWLWVRSYRTADTIFIVWKLAGWEELRCMRGQIMLYHVRPGGGVHGGFDHATHRAERVRSLPPPLWPDVKRERRWLVFRIEDRPPPSLQQVRAAKSAEDACTAWLANGRARVDAFVGWMAEADVDVTCRREEYAAWYFFTRYQQLVSEKERARAVVDRAPPSHWEGVAPLWVVLALCAVFPAARLGTETERRKRARLGLCLACGYDLRATPQRCPECGGNRD